MQAAEHKVQPGWGRWCGRWGRGDRTVLTGASWCYGSPFRRHVRAAPHSAGVPVLKGVVVSGFDTQRPRPALGSAPDDPGPRGTPPPAYKPPAGSTGPMWPPAESLAASQNPAAPMELSGAELADWSPRALGFIIDGGLVLGGIVIFAILGALSPLFTIMGYLFLIGAEIYLGVLVGQFGQTPGMRVAGVRCVSARTGAPLGAGIGVLRSFCHIADSVIFYVGYLWPLWDAKRQTLADKMVSSVVVRVPKQPLRLAPPARA